MSLGPFAFFSASFSDNPTPMSSTSVTDFFLGASSSDESDTRCVFSTLILRGFCSPRTWGLEKAATTLVSHATYVSSVSSVSSRRCEATRAAPNFLKVFSVTRAAVQNRAGS